MTGRELAYLAVLGLALGVAAWFIIPADKPRLLIVVVAECALVIVSQYQAWVLKRRRASRTRAGGKP